MKQLQILEDLKLERDPNTFHWAHLILDHTDGKITIYLTLEEIINMGHVAEQWLEEDSMTPNYEALAADEPVNQIGDSCDSAGI